MAVKAFLISERSSRKYRLNGVIPSSHLPTKSELCQSFRDHMIYQAEQLPPKVDLRSDMTPVEDQSLVASCTANSLVGAYEYLTKKANGRDTDISRLFIYYNARVKDQGADRVEDYGCSITNAIEALSELGTCLESVWPYNISDVNKRPNDQAYQEGAQHRITSALRLDLNLNEMKSCLAQGFPFAFGLRLYASFDQAKVTSVVPMPNVGESSRESHKTHAMLAVGYSDQSRAFIVRNSWGERWGDRGYCYIPYDYITNPALCFDVWTIRKLATNDFGREHWDSDDNVNLIDERMQMFDGQCECMSEIIETYDDNGDSVDEIRNDQYPVNQGYNDVDVSTQDEYSSEMPSNDINFDNEPLDGSINQDCKYLEETTKVDFDENNNDGDQPINTIPDDYDNSSTYPSTFFQTEQ